MKIFQTLHLVLIFFVVVAFAFLKLTATDSDPLLEFTNKIVVIVTAAWSAYTTIRLIQLGRTEDQKSKLLERYRHLLLNSRLFLVLSNLLLFTAFLVIIYQLLFFRSVEFVAISNMELFESRASGRIDKIGDIPANKIIRLRVHVGEKFFSYKELLQEEYSIIKPVNIDYFWNDKGITRIKLNQNHHYEVLQ